jgi:hypothetical protein
MAASSTVCEVLCTRPRRRAGSHALSVINTLAAWEPPSLAQYGGPSRFGRGNMISGPRPGDNATRQHYVHDAWNRLVGVYADDTQNPGQKGDLIASYEYDGQNYRVSKTVEGDPDVTRDYYYGIRGHP